LSTQVLVTPLEKDFNFDVVSTLTWFWITHAQWDFGFLGWQEGVFGSQVRMIRSMTGFGRGEVVAGSRSWLVECASVNRKQLEVVISLPRELPSAEVEPLLRQQVQKRVSRGRVQVQARLVESGSGKEGGVQMNETLAAGYLQQARALGEKLGVSGELAMADLVRLPGVVQAGASEADEAFDLEPLQAAFEEALTSLIAMREVEGSHLKEELEGRLSEIERLLAEIATQAPLVVAQHRTALRQRLADAGLELPLDDERLVKEIALHADRCDISEELARAASHLKQFRAGLASGEAVGRSLDFLSQEFFREFNTMGAKANDAALAHLVVAAKTELEKIREQIQNIE
jgi:uncharacterized protein (TIGR00255 family)